jgi:hypothetical protein
MHIGSSRLARWLRSSPLPINSPECEAPEVYLGDGRSGAAPAWLRNGVDVRDSSKDDSGPLLGATCGPDRSIPLVGSVCIDGPCEDCWFGPRVGNDSAVGGVVPSPLVPTLVPLLISVRRRGSASCMIASFHLHVGSSSSRPPGFAVSWSQQQFPRARTSLRSVSSADFGI